MNRINNGLALIILTFFIQGCTTIGHKEFYTQVSPTKYPATEKVLIFRYPNTDIKKIYDQFFDDYLIIGRSSFYGAYEDPKKSTSYAKSIGSDIFISAVKFKETLRSSFNMTTPDIQTTQFSGYSGNESFSGTATTYGTKTTAVPISVHIYDQEGLYLKLVNNFIPLWQRTVTDYEKSKSNDLDGLWSNEDYKINIHQSNNQMVAFIVEAPKERPNWKIGELKFLYDINSGEGTYLMGNKQPMPSKFKINKFGHLEVTVTKNVQLSFAQSKRK